MSNDRKRRRIEYYEQFTYSINDAIPFSSPRATASPSNPLRSRSYTLPPPPI